MLMKHSRSQGFTILEIMITVTILALGMLGLGALILRGQQSTKDAYDRVSALYYLQFMTERIRANAMPARDKPGAATATVPAYATSATALPGSGELLKSSPTSNGTAPANDLYAWDGLLSGVNKQQGSGATATKLGGIEQAFGCITLQNAAGLPLDQQADVDPTANPYFLYQPPGWMNRPDNPPPAGLAYSWNVEIVWQGGASNIVNDNPSQCAIDAFKDAKVAKFAKSVSSVVTIYR